MMCTEGQHAEGPLAVENTGKPDAVWLHLYESHRQEIIAYFRAHITTHDDVEDFAQDVFMHLLMHKHVPENPRIYLYAVARHLLCAYWRHKTVRTTIERSTSANLAFAANRNERGSEGGPLQEIYTQESMQIITCTIARLPVVSAAVLRLVFLDGLSLDEAARRVGCSREAMKKRLQRARGQFRKLYHEAHP